MEKLEGYFFLHQALYERDIHGGGVVDEYVISMGCGGGVIINAVEARDGFVGEFVDQDVWQRYHLLDDIGKSSPLQPHQEGDNLHRLRWVPPQFDYQEAVKLAVYGMEKLEFFL